MLSRQILILACLQPATIMILVTISHNMGWQACNNIKCCFVWANCMHCIWQSRSSQVHSRLRRHMAFTTTLSGVGNCNQLITPGDLYWFKLQPDSLSCPAVSAYKAVPVDV